MWDSAASLCFITNDEAKAEKLKGEEVELTITKVGGKAEKLRSCKYSLPLIDLKGHKVHFDVYGQNLRQRYNGVRQFRAPRRNH